MKFSKILIICITFFALFLYAYDTYINGLSIFSFIVFISSIIVFLEFKSELKITSKQSYIDVYNDLLDFNAAAKY